MIHFNSSSLYVNFAQNKDYLGSLKYRFQVIAVNKDADFELEGYDKFSVNRINKKVGGVAFYVQKDLQCKVIDSTIVNDVMESLTIEYIFKLHI